MRVDRSFAFLDLCGFTAHMDSRGDREAIAVVALLRATLRAAAEEHGVRVMKWLGDGAVLVGIAPCEVAACSVEVRDAIANESPLPVRGGLARGEVIMFEGDDHIGAAVNTAARLASAARPNQLLAGATFAADLEGRFTYRPVGELPVRGLATPVATCELHAAVVSPPAPGSRLPRDGAPAGPRRAPRTAAAPAGRFRTARG